MLSLHERAAGVLLHITSLPGPHGSGDLGEEATAFAAWLAKAKQRYWQMLPVVPPAAGNSPYQSTSVFAGNPMLIDLRELAAMGLLDAADVAKAGFPEDRVDFGAVESFRFERLRRAFAAFQRKKELYAPFFAFCEREKAWLADFALFGALKRKNGGKAWTEWDAGVRSRKPDVLRAAEESLREEVRYEQFVQWIFDVEWQKLRSHANELGVALMGDVPIFVAHDSADVWAHPELFFLDEKGNPTVVAGVPPDYFSEEGQRWGNVLYRWDVHEKSGYAWWIERFRAMLRHFDAVRVDHFIGFHRYWAIPSEATSAKAGKYEPGPGAKFFEAVRAALGPLPIVAEDLGVVTKEVTELRQRFQFPGMRVLQFSFTLDRAARHILPFTIDPLTVVYTGTHDNDTTVGWLAAMSARAEKDPKAAAERDLVLRYTASEGSAIHWDMARLAMMSAASICILPAQDLLGLGSDARMNVPGRAEGNWAWRVRPNALSDAIQAQLRELTETYARDP